MAMNPEFRDYLLDQMGPLGPVQARRMFGGGGLFLDGAMFGLVADDVLYLKADDVNRAAFEEKSMGPFTYEKKGLEAPVALSYFEAPPDVLEDPEELCRWARRAWEAARRAAKGAADKKAGKKGQNSRKAGK